ncbi:MED6 mediator subfamily complex component domain-containing protein [Hirsutella rhossiliensis]|uniref:Mediator of RNA polymerase II transcription subunit 6 n=1 Tax=Hirsutella rhossiliensis TaxID=111463 RepID=A0A9P8N3B1_9HYPO|nr:MED6 mediator sub complex component domain-containing protein [Hirsutella rhossiliensis]KAH0965201.1 MED6 mediator sub complex component domain-containing protein [Hirsutella rhossiliensis]
MANEPPLDEIQWRSPPILAQMGGLHSNTILFYFAESPFFERTSNNAVIVSQAMNNISMYHFIQTREVFEGRLKTMSGLEFIVGEEPAETGPGMGTGVWVIRKQTRRKRYQDEDEITVHASFFVVGENIYMAPALADILASRIMTISSAIAKALSAAEGSRKWRASTGHVYHLPSSQTSSRQKGQASSEDTPGPEGPAKPTPASQKNDELSLERASEEAFMAHMRHGGEYIDENAITGRPGEFHLSSTGRKAVPPPKAGTESSIGAMNGPSLNAKSEDKKDGKTEKSPKSANLAKPRRRKSKMSNGPTPAQTPTAS